MHLDCQSPLMTGNQGVEIFLTASFCPCNPATLQCLREESHLHHFSCPVCEQNALNAKGQGGMRKLALATSPQARRVVSQSPGHHCVFRMQATVPEGTGDLAETQ